jgi:hypothetical protein
MASLPLPVNSGKTPIGSFLALFEMQAQTVVAGVTYIGKIHHTGAWIVMRITAVTDSYNEYRYAAGDRNMPAYGDFAGLAYLPFNEVYDA